MPGDSGQISSDDLPDPSCVRPYSNGLSLDAQLASDSILSALLQPALRSPRRQVDVFMVLARLGMTYSREVVRTVLYWLKEQEMLDKVIELSDGGILATVSGRAFDRFQVGLPVCSDYRQVMLGGRAGADPAGVRRIPAGPPVPIVAQAVRLQTDQEDLGGDDASDRAQTVQGLPGVRQNAEGA